jgi:hypothetical protein
MHPFTQAVKFFEQDQVTPWPVYLALTTLKNHFRERERSQRDFNPEYALCCSTVLPVMKPRRSKLLDGNFLKAAFWLRSFECQRLSDNQLFIPPAYELILEYHAPCSVPATPGAFNRIWDDIGGSQDFDEQRDEKPDSSYTGDVIMEGELQEIPRSWPCKDEDVRFLTTFLPILISED